MLKPHKSLPRVFHGRARPCPALSFSCCFGIPNKNTVRVASLGSSSSSSTIVNKVVEVAATDDRKSTITVKAIVKVRKTVGSFLSHLALDRGLDDLQDFLGKTLLLELVSSDLDPRTGLEKSSIGAFAHRIGKGEEDVIKYEAEFEVPLDFGEVGAVFVENEHRKEMFLEEIVVDGFPNGPVTVNCGSWVHSKYDNPRKRVFFANKVQRRHHQGTARDTHRDV